MSKWIEDLLRGKSIEVMEGFKLGVYAFAHWKDGEQLVGTTGRKLKDVLKEVDALILKEKQKNG